MSKKYYEVKIESLLPATLTYVIHAESPEDAFEISKIIKPNSVNYRLNGKKDKKATVYELGSTIIKYMKNLIGILR